ncbi:hypothetical protein KBC55_02385 [Patescibacteria group bacterium]|nr:hypothetical protein [Patescibacteria group bacterium]
MANKKVVKKSNGLLGVSVALLLAFLSTAAAVLVLIFVTIYLRESLGAMGERMHAVGIENEILKQENAILNVENEIRGLEYSIGEFFFSDEVVENDGGYLYQLNRKNIQNGEEEVVYTVALSPIRKVFGFVKNEDGSHTFSMWNGAPEVGEYLEIAFDQSGFDVLRMRSERGWGLEKIKFNAILYPAHDTVDLYVTEECSQEQGATAEVSGVVLSSSISTQVVPLVFALPIAKRVPCIDVDGQMTTPLFSNIVTTASGIDFLLPTGDRARLTIEANESGQEYEANVVFNQ